MNHENEFEKLREDDDAYGIEFARSIEQPDGSVPDVACIVTTDGGFPAAAARYFKVTPQTVTGVEAEGQTGTLTAVPGASSFYALNLGTVIPTVNVSKVCCSFTDFRWVFEI